MAGEVFEGILIDYYGSPEVMGDDGKHEGLQPCLRKLHGKRVHIRVEEQFEAVCYEADEEPDGEVCCADATPDEAQGFAWATKLRLTQDQVLALCSVGVVTWEGLAEKTDAELEALPGIGRVTVEKLRAAAQGKL